MFQQSYGPENVPELVKRVFDGFRILRGLNERMFTILRGPGVVNMSQAEFQQMVQGWEAQVKEAVQEVPLGGK